MSRREHALKLFIETLKNYFAARGRMIMSFMNSTGQDKLSIELRALYWYYPGDKVFKKFMDLYKFLLEEYKGVVVVSGEKIVLEKDKIIVSRRTISAMMGGTSGEDVG